MALPGDRVRRARQFPTLPPCSRGSPGTLTGTRQKRPTGSPRRLRTVEAVKDRGSGEVTVLTRRLPYAAANIGSVPDPDQLLGRFEPPPTPAVARPISRSRPSQEPEHPLARKCRSGTPRTDTQNIAVTDHSPRPIDDRRAARGALGQPRARRRSLHTQGGRSAFGSPSGCPSTPTARTGSGAPAGKHARPVW